MYVIHDHKRSRFPKKEKESRGGKRDRGRKGKGKRLGDDETFHFHVLYNRGIICIFEMENDKDPAV
jgi:hypothetical protein